VIVYVDSSLLARAYLRDEDGSVEARRLLDDRAIARYTGTWTRIEVTSAIVRAARGGRKVNLRRALGELEADLDSEDGRVNVLEPADEQVEQRALELAREHGLRALDALHVALASLWVPPLADKGEPLGFASRDGDQADVARRLGFERV
jgi:predicted nucleic acid-binding protein